MSVEKTNIEYYPPHIDPAFHVHAAADAWFDSALQAARSVVNRLVEDQDNPVTRHLFEISTQHLLSAAAARGIKRTPLSEDNEK